MFFKEILFYFRFLIIVTFGMSSPTIYYYTSILTNQFTGGETSSEPAITFNDVTSIEDVWRVSRFKLLISKIKTVQRFKKLFNLSIWKNRFLTRSTPLGMLTQTPLKTPASMFFTKIVC